MAIKCWLRRQRIAFQITLKHRYNGWERARFTGHREWLLLEIPHQTHIDELEQCVDCKILSLIHNYDRSRTVSMGAVGDTTKTDKTKPQKKRK